jgi:hypothetical protein
MSIILLVIFGLILVFQTIAVFLLWWSIRNQTWYYNVSIPWFNNIGQKLGMDNATHIPEPPIKG